MIRRTYVEKKPGFDVAASELLNDLTTNLLIANLSRVRIVNRYDTEGLTDEEYTLAKTTIFSEPPVDNCYDEDYPLPDGCRVFATAYLDGQYDQRADSLAQCVEILTAGKRPDVKVAQLTILEGDISDADFSRIKDYLINPVESHEVPLAKPETLSVQVDTPKEVAVCEGFTKLSRTELSDFVKQYGFAMDADDLEFCQTYFRDTEHRDPTITELRMIDTYWSDHCRHTTFLTRLEAVEFAPGAERVKSVYNDYLNARTAIYAGRDKDITLMDIATIAAKELKRAGLLQNLDESEEINACSIKIDVDVDGRTEPWLLMFKNETHNHPTEIEPFGGAATCLGGAIRDPLSGRSYVYAAMRVTGSGDVTQPVKDTLKNKLPQLKISTGAAAGYSSYGNQIGLATGKVDELYHPGYVAKRMEIGAVVGAAPEKNVVRKRPQAGDVVILLGGRTGRDGIGGATGSSKAHDDSSVETCGAEVQKGNPPIERKLQRLFRNPKATRMIKRCNDFGAGGVSVAIGELADSLCIDLDKVPKKYEGLDGTEIAISESQERMAVVVAAKDAEAFERLADAENLEATKVAEVTDTGRLHMVWNGKTIVDVQRAFLNTNGVTKTARVHVCKGDADAYWNQYEKAPDNAGLKNVLSDLNCASKKGLVERFDSTIGAGTVLLPFGGTYQLTEPEAMVHKLPVMDGETDTVSIMSYGFDPYLLEKDPFLGAVYAVVSSVSKVVAAGGDRKTVYLTLQEYFEKLGDDSKKWGKPFSALLGAYLAQTKLGVAAIGGKDSMSGTFNDISVPPTLVSFAITPGNVNAVLSPEFKAAGHDVAYLPMPKGADGLPDFDRLKALYDAVHQAILNQQIVSAKVVGRFGVFEAVAKMCFGNRIGFAFEPGVTLLKPDLGAFVVELSPGAKLCGFEYQNIGKTVGEETISYAGGTLPLNEALSSWQSPLERVFPTKAGKMQPVETIAYHTEQKTLYTGPEFAKPAVFIPVFPGTNCEYDTLRAFSKAGAQTDVFVLNNLSSSAIAESLREMASRIKRSQIVMIPGGFSGGDEPDGSGKFIATAFRNAYVKDAVHDLLKNRDGLMLGICNGFQALIKLGLVPYGEIREFDEHFPTLTFNTINRHMSCMVDTVVCSNRSPWLSGVSVGDVHTIAISHGEGRFVAEPALLEALQKNGQIATQYVDKSGNATMDIRYNPNGSLCAVEGITSPDGRVFGKMGHTERFANGLYKNICGDKDQKLFASGVRYFR